MAYIKFYGGYYKGETLFGVPDGEGSAYYDNGNYYCGEWSNGKYWGKGKCVNNDGSWYKGEFFNNDMHGDGTFYCADGDRYEGRFQHNRFVSGTLYCANGNRYEGIFKNGCIVSGTLYYKDGYKYEGTFDEQWRRHGDGIIYCVFGLTKRGRFVEDKQDGVFVYDYQFLKIKCKAQFKDGEQVSAPVFYDYNGNPIDTESICFNNSISSYVGEIKDGKRHGKGMIWMNDGRIFVGEFENDTVHGNGMMYHKNGNRHVGKWNHGVPDGRCVQYYTNGTKSLVEYRNGEEIHLAGPIKADEDFSNDKDAAKSKASSSKTNKPTANKTQTTSLAKPISQSSEKKSKKNKYDIVEAVATFEYPEGKYVGKRYYGKRGGFGKMYYHDGSYHEGCWKNDNLHGEGKMYFPKTIVRKNRNGSEIKFEKGSRIEGTWKDSNNGKNMTLILPDGTRKNIRFSHGNFILK